ncbi:MAG: diacylglycerol kinase family protein [Pirellulales bacterium]
MSQLTATPAARRVLVLVNPRAGRSGNRALPGELVQRLGGRGFDAQIVTDLDRACREANRLHADGALRAIVAAGGDGTIAELVNRTDEGVPITTLPLGTENLLARHCGITRDASAVAEIVGRGSRIQLDVGRVTTAAGQRLFLLMASAGLDAEIIRRLHDARRGNISHWSYLWPILAAAATYRYAVVRIANLDPAHTAGDEVSKPIPDASPAIANFPAATARWVVAFNLPCYAGMLRFLPHAGQQQLRPGTDGQLDVCRFDRGGFWHTLYYYVCLLLGRAERIGTRRIERLSHFRLEAVDPSETVPLQVDGDAAGHLPAEVDVLPRRLTLLVPATIASMPSVDTI